MELVKDKDTEQELELGQDVEYNLNDENIDVDDSEVDNDSEDNFEAIINVSSGYTEYLHKAGRIKNFDPDEIIAAVLRWQADHNNKDAEFILLTNIRFVYRVVNKHYKSDLNANTVDDLLQEGVSGLFKAAEEFKLEKKVKFATYAYFWIRQYVGRYLHNTRDVIRKPVYVYMDMHKLDVYFSTHPEEYQVYKGASMKDFKRLAKEVDVMESSIYVYFAGNDVVSLDQQVQAEWDHSVCTLGDLIDSGKRTDEEILAEASSSELQEILKQVLTEREYMVICKRFGFEDGNIHTLEEVGKEFKVTRERIRQIEAKAIRKLRHPKCSRRIRSATGYEPSRLRKCYNVSPLEVGNRTLYDVITQEVSKILSDHLSKDDSELVKLCCGIGCERIKSKLTLADLYDTDIIGLNERLNKIRIRLNAYHEEFDKLLERSTSIEDSSDSRKRDFMPILHVIGFIDSGNVHNHDIDVLRMLGR